MSKQKVDNKVTQIYEDAKKKLRQIKLDLDQLRQLLEKNREMTGVERKRALQGTPYDKNSGYCPFEICGGDRGMVLFRKRTDVESIAIQCPCVNLDSLKEYIDSKPGAEGNPIPLG